MKSTSTPVPKTVVVVLGMKQACVPALIVRGTAVVNGLTEHAAMFPKPNPALTQVEADLAALTIAESALGNRTGTREARDEKKRVVVADLQQLHAYVQTLASASPDQAHALADAATMSIRKRGIPHRPLLAIKQSLSGSVKVVARVTNGAKAHAWEYSIDAGKTWLALPLTTRASNTIHGVLPGTTITVHVRVLTKHGIGDWSQPVSALVT